MQILFRFWLAGTGPRLVIWTLLWGACTAASALTVTRTSDLSFGALVPGSTNGTVVLTPNGVRSRTAGVVLFSQAIAGAQFTAAAFSVTGGAANANCALELPSSTPVSNSGGVFATVTHPVSSSGSSVVLDAMGNASFTVGASLNVAAEQAPGHYSTASFTVDVICP